jgi:hypothetical protein
MSIRDHQFIFICGLHRSGTSLLHECIRAHPSVSGFKDTDATEDEGQHLQSVYPPDYTYGPVNRFGFDPRASLDESSDLVSPKNAQELYSQWSHYYDVSKPYLVEKSPPNSLRTRFLQALFPNSVFIVILRHPLATSFATIRWNAERIDTILEHWLTCHERFNQDINHINNIITLKYEHLTERPVATLNIIFSFLNLESIPPNSEIRQDVNEKYFDLWKRRPIGRYNFPPLRQIARLYIQFRYEYPVRKFGYSLINLKYNESFR